MLACDKGGPEPAAQVVEVITELAKDSERREGDAAFLAALIVEGGGPPEQLH